MYYLYIDESGDPGDYRNADDQIIEGSSKFFTLAGIIVHDNSKRNMNIDINSVIDKYFASIQLPANFKLHYHPLRNKRYPYDQLLDKQRKELADDVFKIIKKSESRLLSVTIDLDRHCKKYDYPADPIAYALLIILERFQEFLEEKNEKGIAIYERFNKKARKKAERTMNVLRDDLKFRHYKEPSSIGGHIRNGDPKDHPILQIVDFFAYATWIRNTTDRRSERRWQSIKDKYFRLDCGWYKAGNVEI